MPGKANLSAIFDGSVADLADGLADAPPPI